MITKQVFALRRQSYSPSNLGQRLLKRNSSGIIQTIKDKFNSLFGSEPKPNADQFNPKLTLSEKASLGVIQFVGKRILKSVFGIMANTMNEMQRNQDAVVRQVCLALENDHIAQQLLGNNVTCVGILSSGSSSTTIKGVQSAKIHLVANMRGSKSAGRVEILASLHEVHKPKAGLFNSSNNEAGPSLCVDSCKLQTAGGVHSIKIDNVSNVIINV